MAKRNKQIKNLTFSRRAYPEVIDIANRLATLENRNPHDSIRLLILSAGSDLIKKYESTNQPAEAG